MIFRVFVINPGSTSTKLALFRNRRVSFETVLRHEAAGGSVWDQFDPLLDLVRKVLQPLLRHKPLHAVVGRGGLLKPLRGGTYGVTDAMMADARANVQGEHAANLGCVLAGTLGKELNVPAYTVDPISVDELEDVARYSGHPLIQRRALSHALNLHAVARAGAQRLDIPLRKSRFIVAHLGGGISIAPVRGGKIIDVNDASSDGPFSPDRTGGLPLQPFISLCFSGRYSEGSMRKFVMGEGGLRAYLGTDSLKAVEERISAGDTRADSVLDAMCYQIAKEIAAMSVVLRGGINAIILTGGLAHSQRVRRLITARVRWIAPVWNFAGEREMHALAEGALRILQREEKPMYY